MQAELLAVDHLAVAYGQSEVIPDISLSVPENEILAVMGINGMGKTTLMKALIGILPSRKGQVVLGGIDLTGRDPHERVAAGLAYVPQGRMVFPTLTVEENIKTGLKSDREQIPEDLYKFFPVLKEMRKRRAGNLSGGQQQQLVIARALASRPKLLLLDEPTEGIQPSIIKELAEVLKDIRDKTGITILVSEQVLSFALALADRIVVLDRGKVVHDSPRSELDATSLGALLAI
jgi:urea transport system ATP-binding protein